MLKLKTNIKIVDFKGKTIKDEKGEDFTIGDFIADVLAFHNENPSRCWQLGRQFATEKEVELKAEDVVFIKGALEKASTGEKRFKSAMSAGQVIELLDGKN